MANGSETLAWACTQSQRSMRSALFSTVVLLWGPVSRPSLTYSDDVGAAL